MSTERAVRWTQRAERDLDAHHARLSARDEDSPRRFAASVLETVLSLSIFPSIGEVEHDLHPAGRYRSLTCEGGRIVYRAEPDVIWILRIRMEREASDFSVGSAITPAV